MTQKLLLLILVLCFTISLSVTMAAKPKAAPDPYRYAYAHSDCAPWDGAALKIVLQQKPFEPVSPQPGNPNAPDVDLPQPLYPQYVIYLYPQRFAGPLPKNEWITLHDVLEEKGNVSFCKQKYQCERAHGVIRFSELNKDTVKGEIIIDVKTHRFEAPMLKYQPLCG